MNPPWCFSKLDFFFLHVIFSLYTQTVVFHLFIFQQLLFYFQIKRKPSVVEMCSSEHAVDFMHRKVIISWHSGPQLSLWRLMIKIKTHCGALR